MLGVENKRDVKCFDDQRVDFSLLVVQLQEVESDGIRGQGLSLDALVAVGKVVPIDESRAENGNQPETDTNLIVCFSCLNQCVLQGSRIPKTELTVLITSMLLEFLGSSSRIFFKGSGILRNLEMRLLKAASSSLVGSLQKSRRCTTYSKMQCSARSTMLQPRQLRPRPMPTVEITLSPATIPPSPSLLLGASLVDVIKNLIWLEINSECNLNSCRRLQQQNSITGQLNTFSGPI